MPNTFLDLKSSICTDNPTGSDVYPFSPDPTQVIENTGIERNGGVAAQFEQQTTFTTSASTTVIAKDGTIIQVDSNNNVLINNSVIGNVGTLAVYARGVLPGYYVDACWTKNSTILGLKQSGLTLTVDEYDPYNATVTNTRNLTFASFPNGPANLGTTVSTSFFVRYVDMAYADNQEFVVTRAYGSPTSGLAVLAQESGLAVATLAVGGVNFVYRFAAGTASYMAGIQGLSTTTSSASYWYIGTLFTSPTSMPLAQFCTIDRYPGTAFSRALITYPWTKTTSGSLSTIFAGGYFIGQTSTGTFSTTPISFLGASGQATAGTFNRLLSVVGPGQSEAIGTLSSSATFPNMGIIPSNLNSTITGGFAQLQGSFDTLINFFGKLSNIDGNKSSLVEWRSCSIASIPSYLSVAVNDKNSFATGSDMNLGVPITNNGEYDPYFVPHIDDNPTLGYSRILYRSNNAFFWVDIRARASMTSSSLATIGDNSFLVNSLSPINVIDLIRHRLVLGINDFNGRAIYGTATGPTFGSSSKVAVVLQDAMANSFDVGDKVTLSQTSALIFNGVTLTPVAIALPNFLDRYPTNFGVNVYYNDTYVNTFSNFFVVNETFTVGDLIGSLYVPTTVEPFAMGLPISNTIVQSGVGSLFLGVGVSGTPDIVYDYAGVEIGNDILGTWQAFFLYGNRYIFDGNQIWLTQFNGSLYSNKIPAAVATGMTFIAVSPTAAYFLSSFDNSLYAFDGGRTLAKVKRMNDVRNSSGTIEAIQNGVYNERDNTLLLQTANSFVWMRDGVFSQTYKKANQTSTALYDTQSGIQIANNSVKWLYSYSTLTSSTVFPLTWRSAYHGTKGNNLSEVVNWVVTLFSPDGRITAPVTLTAHSFDQDGYHSQVATLNVTASDWDSQMFFRARIQPKYRKALAHSIQVDTTKHLVITDVTVEYEADAQASIRPARSA